jgi:hypothetical protein
MMLAFTVPFARRSATIVRTFRKKAEVAMAREAAAKQQYAYTWPDGTTTTILVSQVDSSKAKAIRRRNEDLRGYEWMADTVISHGKPMRKKDIFQETGAK